MQNQGEHKGRNKGEEGESESIHGDTREFTNIFLFFKIRELLLSERTIPGWTSMLVPAQLSSPVS